MSEFAGMEDLLQDFLVEAGDLLSGVDNKLVDLERSPVVADGVLRAIGLGERDRHVHEDPRVGRIVPVGEPVRRERRLVLALPLEGQALVQVVETLRLRRVGRFLAGKASPEAHRSGSIAARKVKCRRNIG